MNVPPPMPPDALPWALRHALGPEHSAALWSGCFEAGRAIGRVETALAFVALALAAIVAGLVVAMLWRDRP